MRKTIEEKQNQMRERWSKRPGSRTRVAEWPTAIRLKPSSTETEVLDTSAQIKIPDKVTSSWITKLTDDQLREVEKQLVTDIQEIERLANKYVVHDIEAGIIRFLDFKIHTKLCGRATTLRRRHDCICEEFVRREMRDPSNTIQDGLRANYPAMPTRSWLAGLSDEELLIIEQQSRNEIEMLQQKIDRLYRKSPAPPDRDEQVNETRMEQFRQQVFCWFAWLEVMQRNGLVLLSGTNKNPHSLPIWDSTPTPDDYAAGRAEQMLLEWLEGWADYEGYEPLLYDLLTILRAESDQNKLDEQLSIKSMFREITRSIHPDLAASEEERILRNRLMAEANKAYEEHNIARLKELLQSIENRNQTE